MTFSTPLRNYALSMLTAVFLSVGMVNTVKSADTVTLHMTEIPGLTMPDEGAPGTSLTLTRKLFATANINLEEKFVPWKRAVRLTEASSHGAIIPFSRTPEREKRFQWIIELAPVQYIFVTFGDKVNDLESARKLGRVGVWQGTSMETDLHDFGFENLVPGSNDIALARMLAKGRIDAWYSSVSVASHRLRDIQKFIDEPLQYGKPIKTQAIWVAGGRPFPPDLITRLRAAYQENE